jgi:hypothetical protein
MKQQEWTGEIEVFLENGKTWRRGWDFKTRRACSKPAKVLAAAREDMKREKVDGRSSWTGYSIDVYFGKE